VRRVLTALIAPEPADPSGHLTVAATLVALLPGAFSAVLGGTLFVPTTLLFHLWMRLWPALGAIGLVCGFTSRSRTARAMSVINLTYGAVALLVGRLSLEPLVSEAASWGYKAALASAVGVWLVRSLRRWAVRDAA
jgi:hypothetical protein